MTRLLSEPLAEAGHTELELSVEVEAAEQSC